jgi:hypothetical protein
MAGSLGVAACVPWNDSCAMGDVDDFHRDFLPRFIDAQRAFHDGDPEPNNTLWSTTEPVSLFAARGLNAIGSEDVTKTFRFVSSWFSDVHSYEWELLASDVSGDMAYTVAIERYTASSAPFISSVRAV